MKQKIVDFPTDGKYPPEFNPANYYSMNLSLERFNDAGWLSNDPSPKIVEELIESIKEQWSTEIPYGFYDNFGHSTIGFCNYLLKRDTVDKLTIGDRTYGSFGSLDNKILFARISFGPESKQECWDKTTFDRLHMSVYARRIINPLDEQYADKSVLVDEGIYFSMRWINNIFSDHSTEVLNFRKSFEELRTTYFLSREINEVSVDSKIEGDERYAAPPKEFIERYLRAYISKEVSKNYGEAVALNHDPEKANRYFSIWKNGGRYKNFNETMPEPGYEHVLGILSKHGDVKLEDFAHIKEMNHVQGADYFLNKIVPAVKNFVNCKTA